MEDNPKQAQPHHYRITRVYTRQGDQGATQLASGRKVPKNHPRLNAYGTVDELQVAIGVARDALNQTAAAHPGHDWALLERIGSQLVFFQQRLFTLCADLATPLEDRRAGMPLPTAEDVLYIEQVIDLYNQDLPPLEDFILPGGHAAATALHVCRVVCRRAEREVEALAAGEAIGEEVRPTLNRLSDVFFVMARRVMRELERAGIARDEQVWHKDALPPPLK